MQTQLADFVKKRPDYPLLDKILRACVHCGFCNATCPTYQLTGDELDGPRGRIYLLKQLLEGEMVSTITQQHLDRCLTCRACETTCPSGVSYSRLLDAGREIIEQKVQRNWLANIQRCLIRHIFPFQTRFAALMYLARLLKPLLPKALQKKIPEKVALPLWPKAQHTRKMLLLAGCVQTSLAPQIDVRLACVLDTLGISLLRVEPLGCCGALNYHLADRPQAENFARQNIDACWPHIEQGVEAIVSTASGCVVMLKDYAELLQFDAQYAEKARKFVALTHDVSELLSHEKIDLFTKKRHQNVAFQSPCTLQHGQRIEGVVEALLARLGYHVVHIDSISECCGSAGVFSLLQPQLATQLRDKKLTTLQIDDVDLIATANIGCLSHLQSASSCPVVHWVELIE